MSKRSFATVARTVGFVVLLICVTTPASAQRRRFLGVTGGAAWSDFGNSSAEGRWGPTVGVAAGYRTSDWSVVSLEASWIRRGSAQIRLDYIEVPLLIGAVAFLGSAGVRARFYAGPQLGFRVGCEGMSSFNSCASAEDVYLGFPFGAQFGRWGDEGTFFAFDVRYVIGVTDVFGGSNVTNQGWQFKLKLGRVLDP